MENFVIWNTVSMAWTEVGLSREDYPEIASELRSAYPNWREINDVILGDVLGSFALESALFPLALVPLIGMILITPFPDWGYEEAYLLKRIELWHRLPRWRHYMNPIRIIGYPLAYLFSLSLRHRLRAAYYAADS
ncbi:MAG: hypothetical protein ABIU05_19055 [Nitrospirales bacterium]